MNVAAAVVPPAPGDVSVRSSLLGPLVLEESQIFTFERGLLGFPEARSFGLVPARRPGVFWLQSLDFEALTFLLADPFPLVQGYALEITEAEFGPVGSVSPADVLALAILTLPKSPGEPITANLQGPLIFNLASRAGRQVVLQETAFGVRHPVEIAQEAEP